MYKIITYNMKNLKTIIFTACALFSLGATASTEHTTVQGDHGKLDVVIQRPDNNAGNGSQAKAGKKTPLLVLCHGFGGQEEQAAHIASDFLAKILK